MNAAAVLAHALSVAHGVGASLACVATFYLGGLALVPRRWDDSLGRGESPAVIGAALYVLLCWFGIRFGVPVERVALGFAILVPVMAAARYRWLATALKARILTRAMLGWLLAFSLLYVLTYLFTLPPATDDFLPPAWTGNVDLLTYVRYTKYLLRLGQSNQVGFSYLNFTYLQTPGVFYLLGWLSFLFGHDPIRAAMPAQFALTAFIGIFVARISRSVFSASRSAALAIACIVVSGPFFRYVAGAYFLSTLMSTPILLYALWTIVEYRAQCVLDVGLAVRFGSAYILLVLMYPFLLFVGLAAQTAAIVLTLVVQWQSGIPGRTVWRGAGRTICAVLVPVALVAICLRQPADVNQFTSGQTTSRLAWSFDMVRSLSEKGVAGWPLGIISPLAMLGLPGTMTDHVQCASCLGVEFSNPASRMLAVGAFCAIASALAFLYFWRFRHRTTAAARTLAGLAGGSFILYCAYFYLLGPSYQQWKFASYSALPWSFVVFAGGLQLFRQSANFARATRTAFGRRLVTAVLGVTSVGIVGSNLVIHALGDPELLRFPGSLRNISKVDELPSFRELSVWMDEQPNAYPTWLALYYLPTKRVHVISSRFSPSEPLSFEHISRQRPLLIQGYGCEGVGHGDTMTVPSVGCLLLAPPSVVFATSYPFNRSFLFIDHEGLSVREPWGRWNFEPTVHLKLTADLRRTWVHQDTFVNLLLNPYLPPGTMRQRVLFSWDANQHAEASLEAREWISLPVEGAAWTGDQVRTLAISIDLPDGVTPQWMYAPERQRDSDKGRPLAVVFEELSISSSPRGRTVPPIAGTHDR